jgi:RNA polymerase sigma-70 factor (ECF subfamily)
MRAEVEQALKTLQDGQPGAAESALALLQNTVFSFSMRVCGHREDAEDTSQETLVKTVQHLARFDNAKALGVWLYKVAKNQCLMSRRRSKFAPKRELSLEELMPDRKELEKLLGSNDSSATPEMSLLRSENQQLLKSAVEQLPPQYRLILVLHDMEELSIKEIAAVTGLREGTVRVRLHRARVHVRNSLARQAPPPKKPRGSKKTPAKKTRGCKALFGELSDYLDGALDDSLCDELEKHLDGCSPCQAFLDSLSETVERCRRHEPRQISPRKAARLRRDLLSKYQDVMQGARTSRKCNA